MIKLKKMSTNIPIIMLIVVVAFSSIYSDCAPPRVEQTGEITGFSAEPDFICLGGFGALSNPTARINFTAVSSNRQQLVVSINGRAIGTGIPIQTGEGNWSGFYSINLNQFFQGQIPPQFTVVGKLMSSSSPNVQPTVYDESSCTITTNYNCSTPGFEGN